MNFEEDNADPKDEDPEFTGSAASTDDDLGIDDDLPLPLDDDTTVADDDDDDDDNSLTADL